MRRSTCLAVLLLLTGVGAAVRLNNALTYPSLRAFDGFGHFTYIWFMAEHWRVPSSTAGWSFFHPPLYYALMASIWTGLGASDPVTRLAVGTSVIALLGLVHALAIYLITRRYFPDRHLIHLLAAGLMLFLPAHLYSAGFLGNEGLNAVLCTVSLLALLATLRRPTWLRGALLGVCLGGAMLTKFTAAAVVAGAIVTLALWTARRREWKVGLRTLAVVAGAMVVVCGPYYARNLALYGTPFKLSRDEFMVRHIENFQTAGRRTLLEYVLFDPLILRRPQWPRGVPLTGVLPSGFPRSPLRESVLTGVYANAWFDAVGGMVLPPVTTSETSRRAGQILLTLGMVPSILVVVGVGVAIRRLVRRGWDDTLVAMLVTFAAMVGLFVHGTRTVPMHAAVKTTYLTPVSVVFAFWFALGAESLGRTRPRWLYAAAALCAALATASVVTFSNGVFIARGWLVDGSQKSATWQNLYGIVYYAGGDRDRARDLFRSAATANWHLGHENLAYLALEDDRPLEALYHLREAARLAPLQSFGTPRDRAAFDRFAAAEYLNAMAVIYDRLGWAELAVDAARKALDLDATIPETSYDLAVLKLFRAFSPDGERDRSLQRSLIAQSRTLLLRALVEDPAFTEARALAGALDVLEGDCTRGAPAIRDALAPRAARERKYPLTTGPGDMHSAGLRRRMHIESLPARLDPRRQLARCTDGAPGA